MLQLTNVAGPRVGGEEGERFLRDPRDLLPDLGGRPHREAIRQRRNVLDAIPQWRDHDRHDAESIVEILAERPRRGQIAVRRRDHSHVHANRRRAPHTLELLLLQRAQELRLELEVHLGDLVEQQGTTVRSLERSLDALHRAREGTALVTEQRALHQTVGQGSTVQLDERLVAAIALVVDRPRQELLPGTALALQQDRYTRGRRHRHRLQDSPQAHAVADLALVAELHHLAPQRLILAAKAHELQRSFHRELELLRLHRLRDVVDRPRLDRGDRVLDARVLGEHDERHVVAFALQQRQELEPRQPQHAVVGDDEIDVLPGEYLQRLDDVRRTCGSVPGADQRVLEKQSDGRLVVDV